MSEVIEVPAWLRTRAGEPVSERFLEWITQTQTRLKRAFPQGEQAFCRIIDKLKPRMGAKWRSRLHYTRQKWFKVSAEIVFFGDFYFKSIKTLVEIDGDSHASKTAREKDAWRTRLIGEWGVSVLRFTNDEAMNGDFREIEQRFAQSFGPLAASYANMRHRFPSIYRAEGVTTTKRHRSP